MTGKRRWRISILPALVFVTVLPVLLGLGVWQVKRGAEKAELYAQFGAGQEALPRDVTKMELTAFNALPRYERIALNGHYLNERQFLLDNMSRNGRPGHHVLTPFKAEGAGYLVIVDRGWRAGLAQDAVAVPAVSEARRQITGMLAPLPRPALHLGELPVPAGWPKVMQFPDAKTLSGALGQTVAEPRLLLDDDAVDGFTREWRAPGIPPARHYAYAFQWFALAVAWIVIFVVVARRPRDAKVAEESR